MGSLSGSVLSAIFFSFLLQALQYLNIWKWVIIPLLLILLMQFRPEGLMGNKELSYFWPKLRAFLLAGKTGKKGGGA
jgi:branched-chain amino acid transport system permease protein